MKINNKLKIVLFATVTMYIIQLIFAFPVTPLIIGYAIGLIQGLLLKHFGSDLKDTTAKDYTKILNEQIDEIKTLQQSQEYKDYLRSRLDPRD